MHIPLQNRLKKRAHIEMARLEDEVVDILYGIEPSLVLHGGTAVWRCYYGNRFSEDLDFYCRNPRAVESYFARKTGERGLSLLKLKRTKNLIFCKVSDGNVEVRVEINFATPQKPAIGRYEKVDGTYMDILTLSPEELLLEKMDAYAERGYIRDIYDVYHLSAYVNEEKVRQELRKFLDSIRAPVDEKNLKALVYSGAVPSFRQMVEALKRRF